MPHFADQHGAHSAPRPHWHRLLFWLGFICGLMLTCSVLLNTWLDNPEATHAAEPIARPVVTAPAHQLPNVTAGWPDHTGLPQFSRSIVQHSMLVSPR